MIGIATGSPPAAALARRPVTLLLATGRVAVLLAFEKAAWTAGLTLVASPDGLHAIMSALRRPPTVIVLDAVLPGVDADTVEAMLGRDPRTACIPLVRIAGPPDTSPELAA